MAWVGRVVLPGTSPPDIGNGSELRPWVLRQWMKVEIVDDLAYAVGDSLYGR